jgi:Mn2+/Fe2+ NRAMP family transporter
MKDLLKKLSQVLASIGLIFLVAMLGAIGGQVPKEVRRFILPAVVTIYAYFLLQNWWVLTCYLMALPLSIGYGIPDATDEGSILGKFYFNLFSRIFK